MTSKRPSRPPLPNAPAADGGAGRFVAYAGRPSTMAEARARAGAPRPGFTDRIENGPKWPGDESEVLGPRRT